MPIEETIIWYVVGINTLTCILFWYDKWMARAGGWRVPEAVLWLSALLGGSIGALCAMHLFSHKTRKSSFQFVLALILLLQIGVIIGWIQFTQ